MPATLRGEAKITGTDTVLVFDHAAIEQIEAVGEESIFDLIEGIQRAAKANRKPKLSSLATLLHAAHLRHNPGFTRQEAYVLVLSGDEPTMTAMSEALNAAFATVEAGDDAAADPPKKPTRSKAGS